MACMDDTAHKTALMGLFGELAARELSLKLGRACRLAPRHIRAGSGFVIPPEFGLCAHLPLDLSGMRCALLVRETTAGALVALARRARERPGQADGKEALQDLLQAVLERPFALLGFLANAPRFLQGCVVQEVDTPSLRKAHQIAFQSQGLVPVSFHLEVWGLEGAEMVLLAPNGLLEDAAAGLLDPVNRQEVDSRFLEFAGGIGEEIRGWLDEPDGEDAGEGAQADIADGVDVAIRATHRRPGWAPWRRCWRICWRTRRCPRRISCSSRRRTWCLRRFSSPETTSRRIRANGLGGRSPWSQWRWPRSRSPGCERNRPV